MGSLLPNKIEISLPEDFTPSPEDIQFTYAFHHVAALLQEGGETEQLALRVSTCRNAYLMANALFADLRMVLGHGAMPGPVAAALKDVGRGKTHHAREALAIAKEHLAYFDEKCLVWERRVELDRELQTRISKLPRLTQDEIRGILYDSQSGEGEQAWDRKYYEISSEEPLGISYILDLLRKSARTLRHGVEVARCICTIMESWDGLFGSGEEPWAELRRTVLAGSDLLGIQSSSDGSLSWQGMDGGSVALSASASPCRHDCEDLLAALANTTTLRRLPLTGA